MKGYQKIIGIIILCVILLKIDVSELLSAFSGVRATPIVTALFLNILHIFFKSFRWNRLLERQSAAYSLKKAFLVYSGSIYAGIITPGRVGELFVKALYLKTDKGLSFSKGMSGIIMDRLFDMYLLIVIGIIGIWKFSLLGKMSHAAVVLFGIALLAPLIFINRTIWSKFFGLIYNSFVLKKVKGKIGEGLEDFFDGTRQLIGPELLFSSVLTCLSYFVFFMQCYLLIISMGVSINFITITLIMAITNLISFIPVSVLGLGTRDAALIYLFSLINLQAELAVGYSFLVFFTFFIFNGLMGFFCWMAKPVSKPNLSEQEMSIR